MAAPRRCRRCLAPLDAASAFCGRCGTRHGTPAGSPTSRPADALAPGWYADPFGRSDRRFFDGELWTERVFDGEYGTDVLVLDHPEHHASAWPATGASLALTLAGLVVAFGCSVLLVVAYHLLGHPGGPLVGLVLSELGLWAGLVGTCVLASRRYGTGRLRADFRISARLVDVPIALVGALVARAVAAAAPIPLVASHRLVTNPDHTLSSLDRLGPAGWVVLALIACVGAPCIEELFFRGLLQGQLAERFRPAIAVLATAVVFGAAHFGNDPGYGGLVLAVAIGAAGVVLGAVRQMTGRLGSSIGTHACFNAIALVALAALGAAGALPAGR